MQMKCVQLQIKNKMRLLRAQIKNIFQYELKITRDYDALELKKYISIRIENNKRL